MAEKLKYVSPEYQAQLDALAETLCTPDRFVKPLGELAVVFASEMGNTTVRLPVPEQN